MGVGRWPSRALVLMGVVLSIVSVGVLSASAGASTTGAVIPSYYVDVGGSASVGEQPTVLHPRGQPTDHGYSNDVAAALAQRWPGLRLIEMGCPGATTMTVLDGGGGCPYRDGTQLADTLDFLHQHPVPVLITVDLGFNDLRACFRDEVVDDACVAQTIATVRVQLPTILSEIKAAAAPGSEMIGIGHDDPYLGRYLDGLAGQTFARDSENAVLELDDTLRRTYGAFGFPMANVAARYDMTDSHPADVDGLHVPLNVARACSLTWMCAPKPYGPNQHPNDQGYSVIAQAVLSLVDSWAGSSASH
ncbi:MAG TPA: GDSL-type esterase/lipase family protein [Acidimicrobiales bacterium]